LRKLSGTFFTNLLLLYVAICCSSLTYSQHSSVTINGVVTEAVTGEVLIGANVLVYNDSLKSSSPLRGGATNRYGFYSLPGIPIGTYFLFITSIGYETIQKKIVITATSASLRFDFKLIKQAVQLDEVLVQDKKTGFTETTSTIEVEPYVVKQLPSIGGETDVFRALQLLPGVTAATEISTGIYVRGGSPDQNLTLVDGVVVYNPSHLGGFASTFNSDALQNIKLMKGAFPAEYGGRLSSVLDVTMREGTKEKFVGTAGINMISSRVTLEGPLEDKATYVLSGRAMYLDKILPMIPNADPIPRYNFYDLNGKVNYQISETNKISVSGFFSRDNLTDPPANKDVGFDISWGNSTVNLTWTSINSASIFTNTSLMYTNYSFATLLKDKLTLKDPLDFYTSSVINDFLLRRDMQIFAGENHTIKTGAEVVYHNFSTTTSDYFIQELKYKESYGTSVQAVEASLFLQDEWKVFSNLSTNFGTRLYYFQNQKFLRVEPRFSITYNIFDRFVLRGSFAVAHQALHMLTRSDIYLPTDVWYPSAKDIKPSRAIQGAIGFEAVSFDQTFLFSVEAYYKDMKDLYEYREGANFAYGSEFEEQLTSGRGEAYGLEFFLNKRIGSVNGWIGYTTAWTRRYFDLLNAGNSYYPRYDRRHDISIVLTYEPMTNLNFGATWTYGTGQAFALPIGQYAYVGLGTPTADNKEALYYNYSERDAFRLPPFHKLDISCKYTVVWNETSLELALSIYNVYNRSNPFSKYIGYKLDEATGEKIPVLKQFTLFPFLPTFGVNFKF
jgi:outer membrane cobalamin receptor